MNVSMTRVIALGCIYAAFVAMLSATSVGADETKATLEREIETLAVFPRDGYRIQVDLADCIYVSERWEGQPSGAELLTVITTVDLRTATLDFPKYAKNINSDAIKNGEPAFFSSRGTAIAYSGEAENLEGVIQVNAPEGKPFVRELHISDENAQAAIERKNAPFSQRGDGKSFVLDSSKWFMIFAEGSDQVTQLQDFEQAVLQYQFLYCAANLS